MRTEFDEVCDRFTDAMRVVANWKDGFYGAAYSTRLKEAINYARNAIDDLEADLKRLNEI